jgi:hypothetical protein
MANYTCMYTRSQEGEDGDNLGLYGKGNEIIS